MGELKGEVESLITPFTSRSCIYLFISVLWHSRGRYDFMFTVFSVFKIMSCSTKLVQVNGSPLRL